MAKFFRQLLNFSIDKIAAAAGNDPDVLRLENLDTDLHPPEAAIEATRAAIGRDEDNSYLPFTGKVGLRRLIAERLSRQTNQLYKPDQVIITSGATEGMTDVLLALLSPGDGVVLTDPTYAGMIQRVKLAGGIPSLVPFYPNGGDWRLDLDMLIPTVHPNTKAFFIMNPSMPSGAVLNMKEWEAIRKLCIEHDLWLIYNAAMERILFDNRKLIHPAALPGMSERTITIGSVSKEYRMIGWRIGWVAGPKNVMEQIAQIHIYNVVTPSGFAQKGAESAVQSSESDFQFHNQIWELRRNVVCEELKNYRMIPAAGGWSQLLDVSPMGLTAEIASKLLLEQGKVAVTPMTHWGERNGKQFVRLVFSNEPVERLRTLGERFRSAFGKGVFN